MESSDVEPVTPVQPLAGWIGGKRLLAPVISERLCLVPHRTFAEPFVGIGGLFFRRPWRSKAEVINDINRELVTLFRVLQRHHVEFFQMIRWRLASRADFDRLKATDPATLTDLERAARFLYLQRLAFSGKVSGQTFGISPAESSAFDITRLEPQLADLHDRLAAVTIENLPFADFITRYDRPETLFYLDPPYFGSEDDYGFNVFKRGDFRRLAEQLAGIAGRFALSINDTPEIREIFKAFHFEEVETKYTIGNVDRSEPVRELIFSNIVLPAGSLL